MPGKKRSTEEDGSEKKKKKSLDSKFGGMTEEEVMQKFLPDHLKDDLDVIFIGINPGLYSAYTGHHYSNASNHFWPCLYESGLIPHKMTHKEDAQCLDYGIGFTNIVPRTTRSSNDLTRKEIKEWSKVMLERMAQLRPLVLCFNGKGIYEIYSGKKCEVGIQGKLPGTETVVYVMPSTSGRAASHPRRVDKLKFFHELKALISRLKLSHRHQDGCHEDKIAPNVPPPDMTRTGSSKEQDQLVQDSAFSQCS
jgi:TDG/mug DNA glycosylase family protein